MTTPEPRVTNIVLNWNGCEDSADCLASLQRVTYANRRVMVVDNGSTDNSVAFLRERYPDIDYVENDRNLGFAEGNNVGIRRALSAGADWVMLLNNDTTVEPEFLSTLVSSAAADETIGIIGPQINREDAPDRVWFAGGRICLWSGWSWHVGNHRRDRGQYRGLVDEDYQTGACMMISRRVLETVGELDAGYVSYFEDGDLCLRAKQAGFRVVCCRDARIHHKVSGSTRVPGQAGGGLTPHKAYRKILSGSRFYRRYAGRARYYTTIAAFNFVYAAVTVLVETLRGKFDVVGAICRGFADLFRGRDRDVTETE
ncbi:MAG TPA: glycosyltransferase family 2 protein [Planctomycetota bacterium]|nr:glycosyltransferase family 2 protein [Planctomycetota bacterium]